ncbi:MAG TPA: hypothetical protein VF732_11195 [Nitrospira sp.]
MTWTSEAEVAVAPMREGRVADLPYRRHAGEPLDVYGPDIDHGSPWQFRRSCGATRCFGAAIQSSRWAAGIGGCVAERKTETEVAKSR